MPDIILYTKDNCPLCEYAKEELMKLNKQMNVTYEEVDIYKDDLLLEKFGLMIPVVEYRGERVQYGRVDAESLLNFLKNGN